MAKRITGSSVSKGDLVRRKFTQLLFDWDQRWQADESSEEVGVVLSTIPRYDRSVEAYDCYVFWTHKMKIQSERSSSLSVVASSKVPNR